MSRERLKSNIILREINSTNLCKDTFLKMPPDQELPLKEEESKDLE
jgi:hypothetical protein